MVNAWLETLKHWKMYNPLMDYSMMNNFFMQHAFMKEFSNFTGIEFFGNFLKIFFFKIIFF